MLRFGVGQNLFIYKQSMRLPARDWGRAVTDWYDEVTLFSNKKVDLRHVTRDIVTRLSTCLRAMSCR